NEILDFSRIDAGRVDVRREAVEVAALVQGVADLLRADVNARGLELRTIIAPDVPASCLTDPGRVRQILLNLAGNAVKFTNSGSVEIRVTTASDNALTFAVVDTGIGIASENLAALFEPFSQVDSSDTRNYGGAGLGLSISKRLVELLHGHIEVESTAGAGSTFRVTVPVEPAPVVEPRAPECATAEVK
ncbi:MAG TPA: ATP-binding protein, partial [Bryobacteraceae bacterium]|nr:ATP-binding protein [Bryobacteraceae bacterium]